MGDLAKGRMTIILLQWDTSFLSPAPYLSRGIPATYTLDAKMAPRSIPLVKGFSAVLRAEHTHIQERLARKKKALLDGTEAGALAKGKLLTAVSR